MIEVKGKYTTAKIMIDNVEESCIKQIYEFINHQAFTNSVAIMPDTHAGKGSVIGFTMEMTDKVIPNVVGVDIGCGMLSRNIGKHIDSNMALIDQRIRQRVPMGREVHTRSGRPRDPWEFYDWNNVQQTVRKIDMRFGSNLSSKIPTHDKVNLLLERADAVGMDRSRFVNSVGTLGGGNHFIEFGEDEDKNIWITVHTGSRNFGKMVCEYWQNKNAKKKRKEAKADLRKEIKVLKKQYRGEELGKKIQEAKDKNAAAETVDDLQWLEGEEMLGYLFDMALAQEYANANRRMIMKLIVSQVVVNDQSQSIKDRPNVIDNKETIQCIHNFIDFDDMIIRKGAIRSYENEKMIIPFNMRDGLLICEGKSNSEWNYSAAHGAGRVLSRSAAKRTLDQEDANKQMEDAGIFTTNVPLDEAPDAYKDAKLVEEALEPTLKILKRVKPTHNIKA